VARPRSGRVAPATRRFAIRSDFHANLDTDIAMVKRRLYDAEKHIHFVTFSCYKRRTYLKPDRAKRIVIGQLGIRLRKHDGLCLGFVVMNDHVHAMVWFPETEQLSSFMNKWKEQSSREIKQMFRNHFANYWSRVDDSDPIWQARYYGFNVWSRSKAEEKLDYMHMNPVRAGLVQRAVEWTWSSARWYVEGKSVGLPIRWPDGLEAE
jgi:putative transposase